MTEAVQIKNVVIGTAGHIDHGKSSLVKAMTGIDPDRLQEEKDKGITIDIGFANFLYKDQYRVGLIDVPGHEKFVKNMVAGATGIDIVLLVVAADDGVMPQTREHMEILTLLGVRKGIIALNKVDKVDADTIELATEDVRELVKGTFLQDAPVIPVSALTGQGLPDLWKALGDAIESAQTRDTQGVFRMPIQRVFSAKGQGAVLTGIPVSGTARLGDNLVVVPGDQRGKVRGIQAYHRAIEEARAGHSAAFNLAGVDHTLVQRGHNLCAPGVFEPAKFFSVRISLLPGAARPLKHRAEVKFHVGTSELVAEMQLLDRTVLNPGESCDCQVLLEAPVVAGIGDRFIIRQPSPAVTLGGGRVIRRERDKLRRGDTALMAALAAWADAADNPGARVELAVLDAGPSGTDRGALVSATELAPAAIAPHVEALVSQGKVSEFGPGRALVHRDAWPRAERALVGILLRFHEDRPAQLGMKAVTVQQQLGVDGRTFAPILERALQNKLVEQRGDLLALPGEGGKLSVEERKIVELVGKQLEDALLNPPTLKELGQAARANPEATQNAVDYLVGSGKASVLHGGVLFSTKALNMARDKVMAFLREKGQAAAKDFKEVLPTSRKFLIPLLEWLDAQGVTSNINGIRTLK
ncbi:MAG: selenocysteine-specific translation elongation factor [Planctomycetes bacterium]|jgi:selenocysteine-specific elongation factor|nr:selenocysteine-specific translation elongation factor [Planctomycetota bacterium]